MDFECPYIRTHTKEKLTKISNIIAILPFYQKKILNGYPEYLGIYYALVETIRCISK